MTAKPIIFSAPMIVALLRGTKAQTRRVLKPQPDQDSDPSGKRDWGAVNRYGYWGKAAEIRPYLPGDRLWVREGFAIQKGGGVIFRADHPDADFSAPLGAVGSWRPSIHMPRWASRLTLIVTDVRVQRLQEISEDDARAEGVTPHGGGWTGYGRDADLWLSNAKDGFRSLWNSIHGPGAWDANPWVAAISFETRRYNIDTMEEGTW